MSLKDKLKALVNPESDLPAAPEGTVPALASDSFPVFRASDVDLSGYSRLPIASLGTVGAAFARLPESARTAVTTVQNAASFGEKIYMGIFPDGVNGVLRQKGSTTLGNIIGGGKNTKYVGRMRFKEIDPSVLNASGKIVMPPDPMSMAIAAALVSIEMKLSEIQSAVEDVLHFLKLDKQSQQRGNLDALNEIFEEYKRIKNDEKRCLLRNVEVQTIKRESQQSILFYQEQLEKAIKENKPIHSSQNANAMLKSTAENFGEYQLACYLYAFSTLMDLLLQHNFSESALERARSKMQAYADRYHQLFSDCRAKIEDYHRSSVESKATWFVRNAGHVLGDAANGIPLIKNSGIGDKLTEAGDNLHAATRDAREKLLNTLAPLEDCRMKPFVDCTAALDRFTHSPDALLTDGESVWMALPKQA